MTPDRKYWPKGHHRHLDRMIGDLAPGADLSDEEWDSLAEEIKAIAIDYNEAVARHEGSERSEEAIKRKANAARYTHIVEQLGRIENACNELAASFEEAHPYALMALSGGGVPGIRSPMMGQHMREVAAAHDLVRRYHVPLAPNPSALDDIKELLSSDHTYEERCSAAKALDWSQAARALALIAGGRRLGFAEGFREEMERDRSILHEGADGSLRPSARGLKALRTEAERHQRRRKTAEPNERRDQGGRQNLADEMWGSPKWALARDSYSLLHRTGQASTLSAAADLTFVGFLCSMHSYATGEAPEGAGGRGNHGYGHLADAALKIMGAWFEHTRQLQDGARGLVALDEAFHVRWTALQAAHRTGIVPTWLE